MAKKALKEYEVNVSMTWSMDYRIRAKNMREAKKKAWKRFCRRPPKGCFDIMADRINI